MAPEQIEGLEADARTDIFAFGALLFEMLTGRRAFEGKTRASLIGAILKDEPPPVSRVQPVVPAALDRIISTCLAKNPDDRYQSARDLVRDLTWVRSGSNDIVKAPTMTWPARSRRVPWPVAAALALALIATAVIDMQRASGHTPALGPTRFTIAPPENMSFGGPAAGGTGSATQVAVSPDGQNIVFVAGAGPTISSLAAADRQRDGDDDHGHRRRSISVLVARQPVHRFLRGWQTEDRPDCRRTPDRGV